MITLTSSNYSLIYSQLLSKSLFKCLLVSLFLFYTLEMYGQQQIIEIPVQQDNVLYEDANGGLSNGAGQFLFSGKTGQNANGIRRAILQFDLREVLPVDASIEEVSLKLYLLASSDAAPHSFNLHLLQQSWGEGTADADDNEGKGTEAAGGDASWLYRFHDTLSWQQAGGDFRTDVSASSPVNDSIGFHSWQDAQLVPDVEYWLANPDSNYGWILTGNEQQKSTARRFASRDHPDTTLHPRLEIRYSTPTNLSAQREQMDFQLFPNPSKGSFRLNFPAPLSTQTYFRVFDIRGQLIHHQYLTDLLKTQAIQLPKIPAGLYWLEVRSGNKQGMQKLMVRGE